MKTPTQIQTMKTYVDDFKIFNLIQGCPIQIKLAKELHQLASIPQGPYGLPELQKFHNALPEYQIKVFFLDSPHCIIFSGKNLPHKQILLIKVVNHYHRCNSYSGFLSKSYFCQNCNRGYNQDDLQNHPCKGRQCHSCEQIDSPDFVTAKCQLQLQASLLLPYHCHLCKRWFHSEDCYAHHLLCSQKNSDKEQ